MKFLSLILVVIAGVYCDLNPITSEEADIVRSAWNQLKHREVDILYTIYKENPELQQRFPPFAGKDLEKLRFTVVFAIHSTRIVGYLTQIVKLNGNPENSHAMNTLINELASSHKNRGIPREYFDKLRKTFDNYFKRTVLWTDEIDAAWSKTSENFYNLLYGAMDGNYRY